MNGLLDLGDFVDQRLRAGIAAQLRSLGITAIDIDPRCTVDDPTLFSHRRDAPTGRLASLVWLEPQR